MARQITTLFFFNWKVLQPNKLYVVNIACPRESHVIIWHSYLFMVPRPRLVSNVESNVLDMTSLCCEIERELSMVAQRAGLGGNKRPRRQYFDNLGPLPRRQICYQDTWPAWTRVFLPSFPLGWEGERPWERGWFLIRKLIMTVSRFHVRVVTLDIMRYCNFVWDIFQLSLPSIASIYYKWIK